MAKTEDRLEEAEKRLKEHDIEWEQAEKEWAEEVDREIELRRSLEGERDAWKRRFERFWEGLEGVMGESKREVEKSRREVGPGHCDVKLIGKARKSGSMSKRKSNVIVPIQESSPVPPASVIRKRRRVQDTPEESVVEKVRVFLKSDTDSRHHLHLHHLNLDVEVHHGQDLPPRNGILGPHLPLAKWIRRLR